MSLEPLRRARRTLAPLAIIAYGLPLAIGLFAGLGHGVRHLGDTILEQKRRALAAGMAHASPESTRSDESDARQEVPRVVHTHDGSTHAHSSLLGAMLSAVDDSESGDRPLQHAPSLALHLPATSSSALVLPTLGTPGDRGEALRPAASDGAPLLPPPRV